MNIKKLLATTAIAALAATSANALDLQLFATPGAPAATLVSAATGTIANEVDLSGLGQNTILGMQVTTLTPLPAGDNVKLTVNLPTGVTFNGQVTVGPPAGATLSLPNNFAGGLYTNSTVSSGGASGSSTVTFLIQAGGTTPGFNLALPVTMKSAACTSSGPVTINLTTEVNTPIEGGSATLNDGVAPPNNKLINPLTCVDGLVSSAAAATTNGVIADTAAGTNEDTILALPSYTGFIVGTDASGPFTGVDDTATAAGLGTISASLTAGALSSIAGVALAPTDVGAVTFTVALSSSAGVASVSIFDGDDVTGATSLMGPVATTAGSNNYVFSTTNAVVIADLMDGNPDSIAVTLTGGVAPVTLNNITASVTASTATFSDSAGINLIANEPYASGALETIQRQASTFGPFDWVGDASKGSENLFRVTGAGAASIPGEVIFTNSSAGKNGTFPFTLNTVNGEAVLRTKATGANMSLDQLNPGYGRADVTFNFFAPTPTDIDRLQLRGDVLSTFGGGANTTAGVDD